MIRPLPYLTTKLRTGILIVVAALLWSAGFKVSVAAPSPPPRAREVWIALRADGRKGSGSADDPYDGSTPAKFDALIGSLGPNTHIHLGKGIFQTAWNHKWVVKNGWCFEGAGMDASTIQLVGSLAGHRGASACAFAGVYNHNVSGFVLKNLTIDCNWSELANSAETGNVVRTFTVAEGEADSAIIHSDNGNFSELDVGRVVSGPGIPANSWIGVVPSSTAIGLSSSAVSHVPVRATVSAGAQVAVAEKACRVSASYVYGASNCKFDQVRAIHGYGSIANRTECFALGFAASPLRDASNNVITHCLVEQWHGNYSNPFALAGFRGSPSYPGVVTRMTSSVVEFCRAIGRPGIVGYPEIGSATPFTSGGVNLADVKNCVIRHNRFEDCQGAAYQDTGGFDGVEVSENTVVRGFQGIVFWVDAKRFPGAVFRNLRIVRNQVNIQRRYTKGANYGIVVKNDCGPVINDNRITYDANGPGGETFWAVAVSGSSGTICNNVIDGAEQIGIGDKGVLNGAADSRFRVWNNRTAAGGLIPGLPDTPGTSRP